MVVTRSRGHALAVGPDAVLVDDAPVTLTARQRAVLLALAESGGRVLSKQDLIRAAWDGEQVDEHAVEAAIGRLRSALGPAGGVVVTVVKRGYRLAPP